MAAKILKGHKDLPSFKVFYDRTRDAYYVIPKNKKYVIEINTEDGNRFFQQKYLDRHDRLMSDQQLKQHNQLLVHKIIIQGATDNAYLRVVRKEREMEIFYDLGNESFVKITSYSVQITNDVPVYFISSNSMLNSIKPDLENSDCNVLKKYLPGNEGYFILTMVFIFNCMLTNTHYLALVLLGPAGSGKSFLQKILKTIIDPSVVMLRNQINKTEDLVLAASHCHLLDFNNVSKLSTPIQDTLCTILTGGCSTSRTKYTNRQETVIHTHNPVILNGIGNIVTRDDLYERCLIIQLDKISGSKKHVIPESLLLEKFENDLPVILGGIFNALSKILYEEESFLAPKKLTRMADFHCLGLIVEKALDWPEGAFESAYKKNISIAQNDVLVDSKVAQALIKMKDLKKIHFVGTYSELIVVLQQYGVSKSLTPKELSAELDRLSGSLLNLHKIKLTKLNRSHAGSRVRIAVLKSGN